MGRMPTLASELGPWVVAFTGHQARSSRDCFGKRKLLIGVLDTGRMVRVVSHWGICSDPLQLKYSVVHLRGEYH